LRTIATLLAGLLAAGAAAPAAAQGIYTCVDAKGRRLTADRPILDCIDREQHEIGSSGRRRSIGPSLTAEERAAQEALARKAEEERLRAAEEKRRDRALLNRYPTEASHQQERQAALSRVDVVIASADKRMAELKQERTRLDAELTSAGNDPIRGPRARRAVEGNEADQGAQQRFLASQAEERQRITARFDEEIVRLRPLWRQASGGVAGSTPASTAAPATAPARASR
jgi:hypothetical protein